MKKLDFTPQNVINCVHNEPALWDTECTDVHLKLLHVSTHITGFHFWKHSALRVICLSPIYCLTYVECLCFFMASNIDFV